MLHIRPTYHALRPSRDVCLPSVHVIKEGEEHLHFVAPPSSFIPQSSFFLRTEVGLILIQWRGWMRGKGEALPSLQH